MATKREVRSLASVDASYIAGLVDGEGTVTLSRKHAGETRQLVVSISNTEAPILDYVLKTVGAGKITRKRTAAVHHTPSLTFSIWNRQALNLLTQIEPHLRSYKHKRARRIIADYVRLTPRNGKYTEAARAARAGFESAVLAIRATDPGMGRHPEIVQPSRVLVHEVRVFDRFEAARGQAQIRWQTDELMTLLRGPEPP